MRDAGTMTFRLRDGTLRAQVHIVQRFGANGYHARQTLTGTVTSGSGRYAGLHGTIAGGGSVVERPPTHIAASDLRYRLELRR